ncbi:hypothetical protein SAMN05421594_4728 [Chryseobacterium oleae]|uniref:Uncharacterized protein n=1 Tax=Chryseobacterium oleae TaxID=491207 RepID=A0A1I5CZJ2_CHROL|nr:hypothetical protein [Chryseobacterium oleae]SFN92307.1 hypothetical protein SAMN05421594_4728 [Chryseobacterium oleae]
MVSGAGAPVDSFDVGAQVLSNWEPEYQYLAMGIGILAIIATKGKATDEVIESNLWKVRDYNKLRGIEIGLDAHHVGQSAVMIGILDGSTYVGEINDKFILTTESSNEKLTKIYKIYF